jgi:hypothetical protein
MLTYTIKSTYLPKLASAARAMPTAGLRLRTRLQLQYWLCQVPNLTWLP